MAEDLRLLSLDGGGVRGLASLYMLRQILSCLPGNPKPCDFFDMICGTSTGGLIAIMLGRLEMSVDQCIEAFTGMMSVIFNPKDKKSLPFKLRNGKIQPRYKTKHLENAIRQIISRARYPSDALFRGGKRSCCKTIIIALCEEGKTTTRFTDYAKSGEQSNFYNEVRIWEVARATSAATSFFEPMNITSTNITRRFIDAGIDSNNPVNELYLEAASEFITGNEDLNKRIRVLVSIGTGRPAMQGFGDKVNEVAKSILRIAEETQTTANTFHLMHRALANRDGYFRFNPPDMNEVALDEASKKGIIAQRYEAHGADAETMAMVQRWIGAAGTEQKKLAAPSRVAERMPQTKLFYTLHRSPKYIKEPASYWQHLTVDSYHVYENIHHACKSPDGKVAFFTFFQQFGPAPIPSTNTIVETWARLLRDKSNVRNSIHPKPFVMAVIYMLHIESCLDVSRMVGIDPDQRETLKRFAKWVPCQCDRRCGREWNFANELGLSRSGDSSFDCGLLKLFASGSFMMAFKGDKVHKLQATRRPWAAVV
ncbi:phospholipase [Pleomassaria siparia CBS 279.74]|uniref:Phospholipase n=1 Tax=Pleomassaria siparia CBS 279.74 TaxID=1314801 RepID=A0A6G1K4H3_9PLEO|nr:phospholipase [Pleomassaria siparia CBS 279.74]